MLGKVPPPILILFTFVEISIMIKIQDLRIGNSMCYDEKVGNVAALDSVGTSSTVTLEFLSGNGAIVPIDDVSPIKLTESVLIECGFVKEDIGGFADIESDIMYIHNINSKFCLSRKFEIEYDYCPSDFELKHLHQLQNMFFFFTGTELN